MKNAPRVVASHTKPEQPKWENAQEPSESIEAIAPSPKKDPLADAEDHIIGGKQQEELKKQVTQNQQAQEEAARIKAILEKIQNQENYPTTTHESANGEQPVWDEENAQEPSKPIDAIAPSNGIKEDLLATAPEHIIGGNNNAPEQPQEKEEATLEGFQKTTLTLQTKALLHKEQQPRTFDMGKEFTKLEGSDLEKLQKLQTVLEKYQKEHQARLETENSWYKKLTNQKLRTALTEDIKAIGEILKTIKEVQVKETPEIKPLTPEEIETQKAVQEANQKAREAFEEAPDHIIQTEKQKKAKEAIQQKEQEAKEAVNYPELVKEKREEYGKALELKLAKLDYNTTGRAKGYLGGSYRTLEDVIIGEKNILAKKKQDLWPEEQPLLDGKINITDTEAPLTDLSGKNWYQMRATQQAEIEARERIIKNLEKKLTQEKVYIEQIVEKMKAKELRTMGNTPEKKQQRIEEMTTMLKRFEKEFNDAKQAQLEQSKPSSEEQIEWQKQNKEKDIRLKILRKVKTDLQKELSA